MNTLIQTIALSLIALIAWLSVGGHAQDLRPGNFVQTSGSEFVLSGKPFHIAGVNNHYLTFASEGEVVRVLDDAVAMGANVVRIFLQPVIGSRDGSMPTIWNFDSAEDASNLGVKGTYLLSWNPGSGGMAINSGKDGMQKVDFLLAEAARRGLKLYIALLDFWKYTGGAHQISAWYGARNAESFFFLDPRAKSDYRAWVSYVIGHRNYYTGVIYRDDPTIFAWDLMNEPAAKPDELRAAWVREMADFVKTLDRNHLVSSGSANIRQKLSDLFIHSIDFGGWHGYPAYYRLSDEEYERLIVDFCAIAKRAGKPAIMSEFGLPRSHPEQARTYARWLQTLDAQPGCAGWLVWRLVARQDSGRYPRDEHDQFDIHNDDGATWLALKEAAARAVKLESTALPDAGSPRPR